MIIGIVSDTHGNVNSLQNVYKFLKKEVKINKFIHLGHDFSDIDKGKLEEQSQNNNNDETVSGEDSTFFTDLASVLVSKEQEQIQDPLLSKIHKIYQVPGKGDKQYGNPLYSSVLYVSLGGVIFVLVHNIKQLKQEDLVNGSVILHGETHTAQAEMLAGRIFVNPGHISDNNPDSGFAVIVVDNNKIQVLHYDLNYTIIDNKNFTLKRTRKFGAS